MECQVGQPKLRLVRRLTSQVCNNLKVPQVFEHNKVHQVCQVCKVCEVCHQVSQAQVQFVRAQVSHAQ